jgi:hypothetical protein
LHKASAEVVAIQRRTSLSRDVVRSLPIPAIEHGRYPPYSDGNDWHHKKAQMSDAIMNPFGLFLNVIGLNVLRADAKTEIGLAIA